MSLNNKMSPTKKGYTCNSQILSDIISKKRDGNVLTKKEISLFVEAAQVVDSQKFRDDPNAPSEYQIGAMLMAIYQQGINTDETTALTKVLAKSGEMFKWPEEWRNIVVDKHSTGGVGDKVSHVLVPALAACGLKVPMVSGRSSELTGGTLDKLRVIPGFRTALTKDEMEKCLKDVGCFIVEQTEIFCPAERVLYKARDVTATVSSSSLLTASILSKKYAEDLAALVFDVKYGKGALVKTEQEARSLAQRFVSATNELGIKTAALITSMDSPLGKLIGNTLEMVEAMSCLRGGGPADLLEMIEGLGGELLMLTGLSSGREEGAVKIHEVLQNGLALEKFHDMILHQGVDETVAKRLCSHGHDIWSCLPRAKHLTKLIYEGKKGYVLGLIPDALAQVWKEEAYLTGELNNAAGIELMVQQGDVIHPGTVWVRIHHDREQVPESQLNLLKSALKVGRKIRIKDVITPQTTRQRKITLPPVHVYRETWENAVCEVKGAME